MEVHRSRDAPDRPVGYQQSRGEFLELCFDNRLVYGFLAVFAKVDSFYSELRKVMTAPGVEFAIAATYDGPWTWPTTDAGKADMEAFLRSDVVITDRSGADLLR